MEKKRRTMAELKELANRKLAEYNAGEGQIDKQKVIVQEHNR